MAPQATESSQQKNDALSEVLDGLPIAALFLAEDGVRLNRAAEELTGYQKHEIAYDKEWFTTLHAKAISAAPGTEPHEEVIVRKDGTWRVVECLAEGSGNSILLLHDITSRRMREAPEPAEGCQTVPAALVDLVCIVSVDGRILKVHGAVDDILGYGSHEVEGQPFTEFIHPNDLQNSLHALESVLKGAPLVNFCNRIRCKDDGYRWLECKALPPDKNGLVYINLNDITTRKELEQTLRNREQLFRGLFHNAPVGIYQSDAGGKHFIANQRWYEYAGVSPDDMTQCGSGTGVREDDRERISSMWKKALESGKEWSSEYSYRTADGRRVWVHGTALQLLDENGEVIGYLGCNIDISERKAAEEALRKSEHRFRLAMEATNDGLWDIDPEKQAFYFSPGCYRMLGFDPDKDQWTYQGWLDLLHPEDVPRMLAAYRDCAAYRTSAFEAEHRMRSQDGTWKWILTRGKAVSRESSGTAPRMVGTFVDISERKVMEDMLRKEHALLNLITETSPVGILFIDTEGQVAFANPRLEEILGYSREELLCDGQSVLRTRMSSPERKRLPAEELPSQRALSTRQPYWDLCVDFERKDGRHVLLSINVAPFFDADGEIGGLVETVEDVTERKAHEEAVRRLNEELDNRVMERTTQLNLAKREIESFSYSVSHDLRAPLRHINSYCTILAEDFEGELPLKAHYYLDRICAASSRMGKLIDDLLKLSRINRAEMKLGPFKISKIAQEVAETLREECAERDVEFVIADGLVAKGDRLLVRQVLENLMENALKYSSKHPSARIEFGRTMVNGKQAFFVKDNGAGFDMAYADKLFQPFQRLHGAEFEGTGIGLATVKRIVERHGGRVWAKGAVDEGAEFYFTLSGPGRVSPAVEAGDVAA